MIKKKGKKTMGTSIIMTKLASIIAAWLLADIRLNANAASSVQHYEPEIPDLLLNYRTK